MLKVKKKEKRYFKVGIPKLDFLKRTSAKMYISDLTKTQRSEAFTRRESRRLVKEEERKKTRAIMSARNSNPNTHRGCTPATETYGEASAEGGPFQDFQQ